MGKELLIALASGIISLLFFLGVNSFIHKQFNIEEIPEWAETIIFIVFVLVLYFKKDFFFSSPLSTGATIGFILSMLWNIRESIFISKFFKTIFSLRFLLWMAVTAAGIYKSAYVLNIWNEYLAPSISGIRAILFILFIVLYILGSTFILAPDFYLKGKRRNSGFTMNKKVPLSKRAFTCVVGIIMVFIFSGLLQESMAFIQNKIGVSVFYIPV